VFAELGVGLEHPEKAIEISRDTTRPATVEESAHLQSQ
jgi:hypothetical protein